MKKLVSTTLLLAIAMLQGCVHEAEILVHDETGAPVSNALIVGTEQQMLRSNRQEILRTDCNGRAKLALRGLVYIVAGREPYYPVQKSYRSATNLALVLRSEMMTGDPIAALVEYQQYKSGQMIYERESSSLWNDWNQYLSWLEEQGYFPR